MNAVDGEQPCPQHIHTQTHIHIDRLRDNQEVEFKAMTNQVALENESSTFFASPDNISGSEM